MNRYFNAFLTLAIVCLGCLGVPAQSYYNPTPEEFPILAWRCFDRKHISKPWFEMIKGCGVNMVMGDVDHPDSLAKTFAIADATGLKVVMDVAQFHDAAIVPQRVKQFRHEKSLAAYFLDDEPRGDEFEALARMRDAIYAEDTTHLVFTNLLSAIPPAQLKAKDYNDYLTRAADVIRFPFFSFDFYPIVTLKNGSTVVSEDFYHNMEQIQATAQRYRKPFWAFGLTMGHLFYPTPTEEHLRFETFTALAYGAQGIEYWRFMHWDSGNMNSTLAAVMPDGKTTSVYEALKIVNAEIQRYKDVFLGCRVKRTGHLGSRPKGCELMKTLPAPFTRIKAGDRGVLVSEIENGGKRYVMIMSQTPFASQKITLDWTGKLRRMTGNGKSTRFTSKSITLPPAGYLILSY